MGSNACCKWEVKLLVKKPNSEYLSFCHEMCTKLREFEARRIKVLNGVRFKDFVTTKSLKLWHFGRKISLDNPERTKQMEEILNFQKPSEGLELVILLHTQY